MWNLCTCSGAQAFGFPQGGTHPELHIWNRTTRSRWLPLCKTWIYSLRCREYALIVTFGFPSWFGFCCRFHVQRPMTERQIWWMSRRTISYFIYLFCKPGLAGGQRLSEGTTSSHWESLCKYVERHYSLLSCSTNASLNWLGREGLA
jgi:hypothetical protein